MILEFIRDRLLYQYDESPNLDYMLNLDRIIRETKEREHGQ